MIERKFVEDGIKAQEIEAYLNDILGNAEYSHTDLKITPVSTRLAIFVGRPGIAIGRAGKNIDVITNDLKNRFRLKNPQIDIKNIVDPNIDAAVIAKRLAAAFERRPKSMYLVNSYLNRIIQSGAVGAEITVSGKVTGSRSRTTKLMKGYIKKCGDIAINYVDKSFAVARLKPGVVGIKVKVMKSLPESVMLEKQIKEGGFKIKNEKEEEKTKADEKKITEEKKEDEKKTEDKPKDKKEEKKPEEAEVVKKGAEETKKEAEKTADVKEKPEDKDKKDSTDESAKEEKDIKKDKEDKKTGDKEDKPAKKETAKKASKKPVSEKKKIAKAEEKKDDKKKK